MERWTTMMVFCFLSAYKTANCNTQGKFLEDLVTTFHLREPTIVIGDDSLPDLCFSNRRVLCLQYVNHEEDAAPLAEHMELLQQRRFQDAVIFIEGGEMSRLVGMLSQSVPSLFRSQPQDTPLHLMCNIVDVINLHLLLFLSTLITS